MLLKNSGKVFYQDVCETDDHYARKKRARLERYCRRWRLVLYKPAVGFGNVIKSI